MQVPNVDYFAEIYLQNDNFETLLSAIAEEIGMKLQSLDDFLYSIITKTWKIGEPKKKIKHVYKTINNIQVLVHNSNNVKHLLENSVVAVQM